MFEETSMKSTGLILRPVSAASIARARQRPIEGDTERMCSLDRWQPDWILVSHELQRIAIVDLCRPSDVHPEQLKIAAIRKQDGYAPLVLALCHYIAEGWTVQVFPWVVGIRGLIDPSLIVSLLAFLDIPSKHRKVAVERTVLASVKALYFMHQVRFGGLYGRKRFADSRQNNSSEDEVTDDEELRSDPSLSSRLRKRPGQVVGINPTGTQHAPVSGTNARHATAVRSKPAVTTRLAEEAVPSNNTRAAANKAIHVVRQLGLLVPAATKATLHDEEPLAAPESPAPILKESNTTAAGSMGCAVVKAATDVVCASGSTTSTNRQCSNNKRKVDRDSSADPRISSKRRTSSGGDELNPEALQEGYSSSCPCHPSESTAQASRLSPPPEAANKVACPVQLAEPTTQVCRQDQVSAGPVRASRLTQSPTSVLRGGRRSPSPKSAIQVSLLSLSPQPAVQVHHQSQSSKPLVRGSCSCQPSESSIRVSCLSQSSASVIRVQPPSPSSESAVWPSQPGQPTPHSLPVPPIISPVEPRPLKHRKRLRTVSDSHVFDTNDPLQEPTPKRRSAPQAQANDLWTQWRNLAQDGRRNT